jgi:nucleotide-binding universal stress UspA family protein
MISPSVRNSIVVGVDGSTSALHAALWAADVAARRGHPLRLMFASNVSAYALGGMAGMAPPQSFFDAIEASGTQVLVDVETAIRNVHPDLPISTDLQTTASATLTLIEQSDDALLLVLGSRGTGGFRGALVGSTAVSLVAHARCPVAIIRGIETDTVPPADGPIVVGVDGSAVSDAAIATAFDEASWRGAELVAVHSWLEYISDPALDRWFGADWEQAKQTENELLAERLAGWQEKYPDVVVRRIVSQGRPAECLLEQAVGAQLMVVGSRGRGGFNGMLLGSTSQALIYHATCPVLVVRPTSY